MAIRKVARMGHPILRQIAKKLTIEEIVSESIQRLIDDMIETMEEYLGAGLAAPQVHESFQISVIKVKKNPRYPKAEPIPLLVLINPEITPLTEEKKLGWEGCLSLPGLRGAVPRYTKIQVNALNRDGNPFEFIAENFKAIVIQHETDHLFGNLFIDRMDDMSLLYFQSEWDKYAEQLTQQIDIVDA